MLVPRYPTPKFWSVQDKLAVSSFDLKSVIGRNSIVKNLQLLFFSIDRLAFVKCLVMWHFNHEPSYFTWMGNIFIFVVVFSIHWWQKYISAKVVRFLCSWRMTFGLSTARVLEKSIISRKVHLFAKTGLLPSFLWIVMLFLAFLGVCILPANELVRSKQMCCLSIKE